MNIRYCPSCNQEIIGRSDKIYCDPYCKSAHQYEYKKRDEKLYFEIDKQLKTNRKILKKYNRQGKTTLRKEALIAEGFNPKYFTHYWKSSKGNLYMFCFEFGFLAIKEKNNDKYLLIQWQDYMN